MPPFLGFQQMTEIDGPCQHESGTFAKLTFSPPAWQVAFRVNFSFLQSMISRIVESYQMRPILE